MSKLSIFAICILAISALLLSCAEPTKPKGSTGPVIPSIDDSARVSIVSWNIERFPQASANTTRRVELIMDSLDADFYCLQEIMDKDALRNIVDRLDQYSVIISDETSFMHLAIVYKQDSFLPLETSNLFAHDDYNFAGRPPLLVKFAYEKDEFEHVLNIIDLHMKCCESSQSDLERRHDASQMLHSYLLQAESEGDSNFVVVGDWNDDIYDPDSSGVYAFEVFLDDPVNFYFVTDSLAATRSLKNASYPGWPSFIDNILISSSLFDEYAGSETRTLRLDEVFGDYSTVVSDHRPVLWSFMPN